MRIDTRSSDSDDFARLTGRYVLVVDDDAHDANVLAAVLEHCGAHVRTATSLDAATRWLSHVTPDVLVIGLSAPEPLSDPLVEAVRALGARAPAVALHPRDAASVRTAALAAGFHECLSKPVDVRALSRVIGRLARA